MSYATVKRIEGFTAPGSAVPYIDPRKLVIVGLDEPETSENWYAHCSRLADVSDDDLRRYADEIVAAGRVDAIVRGRRDGDRVIVVDGRRTTRAARIAREIQTKQQVPEAEQVTVRTEVIQGSPEDHFRVNVDSHKHLPLTRTQLARSYLTYYRRVGENVDKTATFFQVTAQTVRLMLAHFNLSEKAQRAIDEGMPAKVVTKKLARLPQTEQDRVLAEMLEAGAVRGDAARRGVDRAARGEKVDGKKGPRTRSRVFLEKWRDGLRKKGNEDLATLIDFVLGGPLPASLRDTEGLEILESAGYREKPAVEKIEVES